MANSWRVKEGVDRICGGSLAGHENYAAWQWTIDTSLRDSLYHRATNALLARARVPCRTD